MEKIRKIKQIIPLIYILLVGTTAWSQNYYSNSKIYYNMDTTNCIPEARDFFAGWNVLDSLPVLTVEKLYNVYKTTLSIPLLEIKNMQLYQMIEESLKESLIDGTILSPDTSGYFVYLIVESDTLNSQYKVRVSPTSNYYMYDMLAKPQQHYLYNTMGCFYYDSILCVMQSCCSGEKFDENCLWEETGVDQQIRIYQQELEFAMEYYGPVSYFHVKPCE